jgi:hypothetical protein
MSTPQAPEKMSRRKQFAQTYRMAKKSDKRIGLWILLAFLVSGALGFGLFFFLPGPGLVWGILGAVMTGLLGALVIFGRRARKAAYVQMEGQRGSAAAALQMLRRGWKVDPAVSFTKQQDVVHRVVGPPGIILVGEGSPTRVKQLLLTERRKHERLAADAPIHEIVCGNGEGEVPLPKLVRHVSKLGRKLKPRDMTDLLYRLKALDANRSNIPLPKGPTPTSMKGQRGNLRGR